MTKPLVFNYKDHEELRAAYKELLADNQTLMADNRKLRQEVTELKQLNDGYVKIIAKNQETNNKLMASVQKQTGGDYISRADAMGYPLGFDHYDKENGSREFICGVESYREYIQHLPSVSAEPTTRERKEAKSTLLTLKHLFEDEQILKALDVAIECVSAERTRKYKLNDGTEIDLDEESYEIGYTHGQMAERKAERVGEWTARKTSLEFVCSNCGEACWRDFHYCPNCGARMVKESEE